MLNAVQWNYVELKTKMILFHSVGVCVCVLGNDSNILSEDHTLENNGKLTTERKPVL